MSGKEIGLFMIGCGGFARRYHVPVIEEDRGVRLLGICDPMPTDAVQAFAARHGAPVVDRIEALPPAEGRIAAIVTTPHTLHAGHVQATLDRGWHTLCDKPFVMHASEARASRPWPRGAASSAASPTIGASTVAAGGHARSSARWDRPA